MTIRQFDFTAFPALAMEEKLAGLVNGIGKKSERRKDWRVAVGLSKDDPEFEEMIRSARSTGGVQEATAVVLILDTTIWPALEGSSEARLRLLVNPLVIVQTRSMTGHLRRSTSRQILAFHP